MSVDYERSEYQDFEPIWKKIDDVISGRDVEKYLRKLKKTGRENAEDTERQQQYAENAIFYNVSGHTLRGLIGTGFRKEATFDPPRLMDYLNKNADGLGNSIHQQAQATLGEALKKGRAGLWVDYPETDGETSRADLSRFFATIHLLRAEQIINWRSRSDGAEVKLELIVFRFADVRVAPDGFSLEEVEAIKVLLLNASGDYQIEKWVKQKDKSGKEIWVREEQYVPTDSAGNPFKVIPFTFVGSRNNDFHIDEPLMLDIVEVNIGHYRNSADYEDSVFYSGQSQPWMSGVDKTHMDLLQENDIRVGSRFLMPVPTGEQFGFATAEPNPLVRQAMRDKIDMMIGLGARFIMDGGQAKTATEAEQDQEASTSQLSTVVDNVSDAYTRALRFASMFMGETREFEYVLDSDFSDFGSSAEMLAKWVDSYLRGAIPTADYISWMKRQGYFDATKTDDQIEQELSGDAAITAPEDDEDAVIGAGGPDNGAGGAET